MTACARAVSSPRCAGQLARADGWFARAVHDAPSIPFAYEDWGRALLDRAQPDGAIAKFDASPTRKARTSPIRWKAGARR